MVDYNKLKYNDDDLVSFGLTINQKFKKEENLWKK